MAKILLIDDRQDNLIAISAILKTIISDCKVITAQSGSEGIKRAKLELPDTILLDIRMPQINGYEVCILLKSDQSTKHIPIIMLTAVNTDTKSRIKGLELGADAFLTKPVDEAELAAQVKVMLRIKKAEDRMREEKDILEEIVQKRTKQLREREEWYRILFDNANDAMFVHQLNKDGMPDKFIDVNDIACQTLNYTREEFLALSPYEADERMGKFPAITEKLYAQKHVIFETVAKSKEGRRIPVEISDKLFELQGKSIVLSMVRDISERKRADEEKEKIQSQLFHAQKMEAIGILTGGIAHDFNNILTTIQGYISMLMMKIDETSPLYTDMKQILTAAGSAANLTRQLLLFSRKQPMDTTFLNINRIVNNLFTMLSRLIGEDIEIEIDLEPNLYTVRADEGNLEQVLMNLVLNARDAMSNGGKVLIKTENLNRKNLPAINLSETTSGKFICLSVSDTGFGMGKEVVQQIFEPFFTTKNAFRGTGLGLSTVYGIVKQHQGDIQVESTPGKGSTFKIYLPAVSAEPGEEKKETVSISELYGSNERILLIEDEDGVRSFTKKVLSHYGYIVFESVNAREAVEVFERVQGNIHLILSDVILPDKTGIELVDQFRVQKPDLLVLMVSGYSDQKSHWPLIRERGFAYLQKPYDTKDLLRTVKNVIQPGKKMIQIVPDHRR